MKVGESIVFNLVEREEECSCKGCSFEKMRGCYDDLCGYGIFKLSEKQTIRQQFDRIIGLYIAQFEEKHDCYLEYWVSDDTTGIACFGDNFFSLSDIVFDIDNNCPARAIFDWQDYQVEKHSNGTENQIVNFKNHLKGLR